MKNGFLFSVLLFLPDMLLAQQPPASEIYQFKIEKNKGMWVVSNAQNITRHAGYDNQPFFHPAQPLLYYVATTENGKTDIMEYNYQTQDTRRVTYTPEAEYSPLLTPDGNFISCVLQRDNGAQDLVKYPIAGGPPVVIIQSHTVGYYTWFGNDMLYVFALGEPNTLRVISADLKKDVLVAGQPGRSIHVIPGKQAVSYIDKRTNSKWLIRQIGGLKSGKDDVLGETLPDHEDMVWLSDHEILMSDGKNLFVLEPGKKAKWKPVTMAADVPLDGITRLAVNTAAGLLAVVAGE